MKPRAFIIALVLTLTAVLGAASAAQAETLDLTALYKAKDTDASWSASSASLIDLGTVSDSTLTLTQAGDYVLSGSYTGRIVIEAPEDAKVRLILNGVDIHSPEGPAIYEKQADKLIVTLAEGSVNTLADGPAVTDGDDTIGAALYAEDDLSINGSGALTVSGTAKHGIQSKADLIISGGSISVNAVTDGIRGRNSILLLDGSIAVTAGGDGLASTRTDKEGKGWIVLAGGTLDVTTGSGAGTVRASANSKGGMRGGRGMAQSSASSADSGVSRKAVKAATDLTVTGGSYTFNTEDDGLHAANVTVNGGEFTIRTGDDAMHADQEMTVNGGDIRITASDDGLNASGGKDASGFGGRGGDRFGGSNDRSGSSSGMLTVTGGHLEITAGGDGLDSNGSLAISGGITGIWAPTSMGEGAIDFNGTGTLSGGTVILAGNGGFMTSGLSGAALISVPMSGSGSAGSEITVETAGGIASFTPQSAFSSIAVAGSGIAQGQSLTVSVSGKQLFSGSVTADMNAVTSGFDSGFGRGRGGMGRNGFGSGRGGRNSAVPATDDSCVDGVTSPTGKSSTPTDDGSADANGPGKGRNGFGKGRGRNSAVPATDDSNALPDDGSEHADDVQL